MSDDQVPARRDSAAADADDPVSEQELIDIKRQAAMALEGILPDEDKERVVEEVLKVVETHQMYRGPHPSPAMLAELKEVDPSLPNRAMEFAEREQQFRHESAKTDASVVSLAQWHAFWSRTLGQALAVGVVGIIVGVVAFLVYHGKDVSAFAPIIYALAALSTALIAAKVVSDVWGRKDEGDTEKVDEN
jgi:uncharacterized membrane protein